MDRLESVENKTLYFPQVLSDCDKLILEYGCQFRRLSLNYIVANMRAKF